MDQERIQGKNHGTPRAFLFLWGGHRDAGNHAVTEAWDEKGSVSRTGFLDRGRYAAASWILRILHAHSPDGIETAGSAIIASHISSVESGRRC